MTRNQILNEIYKLTINKKFDYLENMLMYYNVNNIRYLETEQIRKYFNKVKDNE